MAEARSQGGAIIEGYRKEFERTEEVGRKMIADGVKSCEEGIEKVRATLTMPEYEASLHQKVRGLNTALAQDKFRAGTQDGDQIKALATVVDTRLQKFRTIYR